MTNASNALRKAIDARSGRDVSGSQNREEKIERSGESITIYQKFVNAINDASDRQIEETLNCR